MTAIKAATIFAAAILTGCAAPMQVSADPAIKEVRGCLYEAGQGNETDIYLAGCAMLVRGTINGYQIADLLHQRESSAAPLAVSICGADEVTNGDLAYAVGNYIRQTPSLHTMNTTAAIIAAASDLFPCDEQPADTGADNVRYVN